MDNHHEADGYLTAPDLKLIDLLYTTHSVTQCAKLIRQTQPTYRLWAWIY